jgi:predicted aspartyl protease
MAKLSKKSNKARYIGMLIDTGADFTLISRSYASLLGIKYNELKSETEKVEIANLETINARKTRINIEIDGENFDIPILIANGEVEALLGRKGVFDRYEVTFQEAEQQVILKKI